MLRTSVDRHGASRMPFPKIHLQWAITNKMCTAIIYSVRESQGDRISCMWNLLWQTIPDYVSNLLSSALERLCYCPQFLTDSCRWQDTDEVLVRPLKSYAISCSYSYSNNILCGGNLGAVRCRLLEEAGFCLWVTQKPRHCWQRPQGPCLLVCTSNFSSFWR